MPTIAAYIHRHRTDQPFVAPNPELGYVENFLTMMFANAQGDYEIDADFVAALNLLLIVHLDHEQNCSTSTVRVVGSANTNLYASIAAGVCALWGPLHGGANEACVNMLTDIAADGGDVAKYVDMAKDKQNGFRLMGFGHRVTKTMIHVHVLLKVPVTFFWKSLISMIPSLKSRSHWKRWRWRMSML